MINLFLLIGGITNSRIGANIFLVFVIDNSSLVCYSMNMTRKQKIEALNELANAYCDLSAIKGKIESLQSFGDVQVSAQNSEFEYMKSGLISAMNSIIETTKKIKN